MVSKIISLILGGGVGSRLYPLTDTRSKPAVPIAGKYRLIDIPISNCLNSGLKRMFVLTQFNSASLNQHIKNTFHFDLFSRGFVDILAAEQTHNSGEWFQGTADAVRQSMHHLNNHDFEYILILSGDQLYQMDFEKLAEYHAKSGADVTIATIPVNERDAPSFGIMKVEEDGFIKTFIEKPKKDVLKDWKSPVEEKYASRGKYYLASMGIYLFNKQALHKLFEKNKKAVDFGKEILPDAITGGMKVGSYAFDGYWTDIGTIHSFFEANIDLTDPVPDFNLFANLYTRPRLLAPSKIFGTWVNRAIIAEGCIIQAKKIDRAVIGIRSRIMDNTEISNAYIMGADYYEHLDDVTDPVEGAAMGVGKDCYIENAILDKEVRIGNRVVIKGSPTLKDAETDEYVIRDGIIVVKKGAYIPSGSKIGDV